MGFLAPSVPSPPSIPVPPPAAYPATMANPAVGQAGQNQQQRARAAAASGTDLTGGQGLSAPRTAGATLLSGTQ